MGHFTISEQISVACHCEVTLPCSREHLGYVPYLPPSSASEAALYSTGYMRDIPEGHPALTF